jgi:hypothetical protein
MRNIEIRVKKMNVYGKYIHNKKMIRTTDPKSGFFRCDIEGEQYVDIKKRPEDADRKKKQVGFRFGAKENSQNGKAEKAAQCQKWRNAIKSHGISSELFSISWA